MPFISTVRSSFGALGKLNRRLVNFTINAPGATSSTSGSNTLLTYSTPGEYTITVTGSMPNVELICWGGGGGWGNALSGGGGGYSYGVTTLTAGTYKVVVGNGGIFKTAGAGNSGPTAYGGGGRTGTAGYGGQGGGYCGMFNTSVSQSNARIIAGGGGGGSWDGPGSTSAGGGASGQSGSYGGPGTQTAVGAKGGDGTNDAGPLVGASANGGDEGGAGGGGGGYFGGGAGSGAQGGTGGGGSG